MYTHTVSHPSLTDNVHTHTVSHLKPHRQCTHTSSQSPQASQCTHTVTQAPMYTPQASPLFPNPHNHSSPAREPTATDTLPTKFCSTVDSAPILFWLVQDLSRTKSLVQIRCSWDLSRSGVHETCPDQVFMKEKLKTGELKQRSESTATRDVSFYSQCLLSTRLTHSHPHPTDPPPPPLHQHVQLTGIHSRGLFFQWHDADSTACPVKKRHNSSCISSMKMHPWFPQTNTTLKASLFHFCRQCDTHGMMLSWSDTSPDALMIWQQSRCSHGLTPI